MYQSPNIIQLQSFSYLSYLNDQQLQSLSSIAEYRKAEKGDFIYEEGEDKKYVYLLEKGSVKLASNTGEGKMLIKDIIHENSMFGENIFAGSFKRNEFAEAIAETRYFQIPTEYFKKLAEENDDFANHVLRTMVSRLYELEDRLQNFVFKSAKERIVYFIKKTGEKRGIKIGIDECLINHGMSHKEIAYLTDTSRQTVARVLSDLKKNNLIHFSPRKPNKILIRNLAVL